MHILEIIEKGCRGNEKLKNNLSQFFLFAPKNFSKSLGTNQKDLSNTDNIDVFFDDIKNPPLNEYIFNEFKFEPFWEKQNYIPKNFVIENIPLNDPYHIKKMKNWYSFTQNWVMTLVGTK